MNKHTQHNLLNYMNNACFPFTLQWSNIRMLLFSNRPIIFFFRFLFTSGNTRISCKVYQDQQQQINNQISRCVLSSYVFYFENFPFSIQCIHLFYPTINCVNLNFIVIGECSDHVCHMWTIEMKKKAQTTLKPHTKKWIILQPSSNRMW